MSSLPRWTLTDLYASPDDPSIAAAFTEGRRLTDALCLRYKGALKPCSNEELLSLFQSYEKVLQLVAKPVAYASLRHAQQADDAEREGFSQVMRERAIAIEQDLVWVELELALLSPERLAELVASPVLAPYKHVLERILAGKPHQLSEQEERLITDFQQTGSQAFIQLFVQEKSGQRLTYKGEERTITEILLDLSSPDRATRAEAADTISQGFETDAARQAFIYTTLIKEKMMVDRYRKYSSPEAARHLSNETTEAAVQSLIEAVEQRKSLFQTYYQWKAKKLGIDQLKDFDRYAPIDAVERSYSFEEAREIVLASFRAFSPLFADHAQAFFDNGWIDAEPTKGKRGGAFCAYVTPDHHPYVFINFQGRIGDVLTLAHELGHAIHATLAKERGYMQFFTPLTLAETASVFAEMLTFEHLRASLKDRPQDLQALCAKKIESVFATVFRQASMHRFEQLAHAHVREHGFASAQTLHGLWRTSQETLFGDSIEVTPGYATWWNYISHFFSSPFYVYAYAYGELLTFCLYKRSTQTDKHTFVDRYTGFLSNGGSANPAELLAPLGINPESTDTWNEGLDWIEELVRDVIQEPITP